MVKTGGIDSVTGRTGGSGKLWYEFEVRSTSFFYFGSGQLSCVNVELTLSTLHTVS